MMSRGKLCRYGISDSKKTHGEIRAFRLLIAESLLRLIPTEEKTEYGRNQNYRRYGLNWHALNEQDPRQ